MIAFYNPDPEVKMFLILVVILIGAALTLGTLNGCQAAPGGAGQNQPTASIEGDTPESGGGPKGSAPTLNKVGAIMLWSLIPLTIFSFTPWGSLVGWTAIAATGLVGVTLMETALILHGHPWIGWLLVAAVPAMFMVEALELKSGTSIVQRVRGWLPRLRSPASA